MLELLAAVAADADMQRLIESPQLTETQLADLIIGVGGERLNEKCANFVRVLADNRRLGLLPDIAALFEISRAYSDFGDFISGAPAPGGMSAQQAQIIESLRKRLGREVELTCNTDASLLGGAIIRAGDLVIDGSVRGKLQRLGAALDH